MRVHCFTSFSFSYLAKARVLAATLKSHHPDWFFWAVVSDREPSGFTFNLESESFDGVIWADELYGTETASWLFKHDLIELCTAVKGPTLNRLLEVTETDKVFYFDPDIAVFSSLQPLVDMLDEFSILLTPHQLAPNDTETAIFDNEVCSLKLGTYNLGFIGIRNDHEGRRFARWWSDCLHAYCYDEPMKGLFVDQKWCDLVPAFFNGVKVIRDPGYNVASWNLSHRQITFGPKGELLASGSTLRFFHFTKLGPIGEAMTQRYAKDNVEVYELWSWYRRQVERHSEPAIPHGWWKYGQFSNGTKITRSARILYRQRRDLSEAYPNPFKVEPRSFYTWLQTEGQNLTD